LLDTIEGKGAKMEKKSILTVDDNKAILKILKKVLESEGYYVDTAETDREAIESLKPGSIIWHCWTSSSQTWKAQNC
jgi:DNA-binding NtrC family response regulator